MGNGTIYHIRVAHELKKKYNSIKAHFYGNDLFEINNTLICTGNCFNEMLVIK